VRGLAYSQLGRFNEAAAEFQTIVDHPGLVLNDPIGPMARLQLARALRAEDRARSAQVYTNLLALWKDADPDIPVLKQAKAESARLQSFPLSFQRRASGRIVFAMKNYISRFAEGYSYRTAC